MKKILVLLALLFSLSTLYSLDGELSLSLGVLGIGFNSDIETINGYSYGRFLNFMYQSGTGLGFAVSPLVFFFTDKDNNSLTFVNGLIFYNFLVTTSESFILGPFCAVNAVSYGHPVFVEFCSGLIFSFRDISSVRDSIFAIDIFFVELGYKYSKTNSHGVYAHVGFDLVAMLKFIGYAAKGREYENYRAENRLP